MKNQTGLSRTQAENLLKQYGPNALSSTYTPSFLHSFGRQFIDPMMLLLLGSAVLIFFIGDPSDAYFISGILFFNAIVGTLQERKIDTLINTVKHTQPEYGRVIRDNKEIIINAQEIVPGDYVIIEHGEQIIADATIIKADNALVNEAIITGEQHAISKKEGDILYKGSLLIAGTIHALITATGKHTRAGKLQKITETQDTQTPLQKDISGVISVILGAIVVICVTLLVVGMWTHRPMGELLATIIALFICVVPQGLPVIMTLILASTAFALLKKEFFVKKLNAVDGLSRCNVIVFDKTGTLTTNEPMVSIVITETKKYSVSGHGYSQDGTVTNKHDNQVTYENADENFKLFLTAIALLTEPETAANNIILKRGNSTDRALNCLLSKCNVNVEEIRNQYIKNRNIHDSYEHGIVSELFDYNNITTLFMMGAPEKIIQNSHQENNLTDITSQGMRALAVAYKTITSERDLKEGETILLGYIGISDTIRHGVRNIIEELHKAGIKTIMATGDKEETARIIGTQTGIITDAQLVHSGTQNFDTKDASLAHTQAFYRMTPEKKIELITYLQHHKYTVAMLGDGFNDAPALSLANTGIALGAQASHVAKQASDALLLDNGFHHLIHIIGYGRHVYLSFKRVILYFFTTNFSEILIIVYSFAMQLPLPLLAPHILWLNLITDGFLDSSLALEPRNSHTLEKGWFSKHHSLVNTSLVIRILYQSVLVTSIAAYLFTINYKVSLIHAQTICLAAMTLCQCAMAINCRSFEKSLFSIGFFSNKILMLVISGIVTGLIFITSTAYGNALFRTTALSSNEWFMLTSCAAGIIILEELRKKVAQWYF